MGQCRGIEPVLIEVRMYFSAAYLSGFLHVGGQENGYVKTCTTLIFGHYVFNVAVAVNGHALK